MTDEEKVDELFDACRHLIDHDGEKQVSHYIEHAEYEMAFEGLIRELIAADATPSDFNFGEWKDLAQRMGLAENAVFDGDFWNSFLSWAKGRALPLKGAIVEGRSSGSGQDVS